VRKVRPAIRAPAADGATYERDTQGEEESQKGNKEDYEEVDRHRRYFCEQIR
jgi:hypothetical protein